MGDERRERRNETYCKAIMGALKINPYIDDSVSIRVTGRMVLAPCGGIH